MKTLTNKRAKSKFKLIHLTKIHCLAGSDNIPIDDLYLPLRKRKKGHGLLLGTEN